MSHDLAPSLVEYDFHLPCKFLFLLHFFDVYKVSSHLEHDSMLLIPTTACFNCREKLEAFLLDAVENGLVTDGALAQDINQASSFWHIREVQVYNSIS